MILVAPRSTMFARHKLTRTLQPLVLLALLLATFAAPAAYAADTYGYKGPSITGASSGPTGEKPESKLWWNEGFWWASMWDTASGDYHIFKLDRSTQTWRDTGVLLDTRSNSRADTLWDEAAGKLYVASHVYSTSTGPTTSSNAAKLYRFSYNATTDQYTLDAGFPQDINQAKSETLVIDKDSTGRLWATWVQQTTSNSGVYKVYVNWTTNGDSNWTSTPYALTASGATVNSDDISSLVAFVDRSGSTSVPKIGVMWSNQRDDSFYFASHTDGSATTEWTTVVARSDTNVADDHVNLKSLTADDAGNVFAALKTSIDGSSSSDEQIFVLVRRSDGSWRYAMASSGAENQTRPILLIDQTNRQLFLFTSTESGGSVYYKQSGIDTLSFPSGLGTPFIQDGSSPEMNNATSTKQTVSCRTGIVVLASNDTTDYYWHNSLDLPGCGSGDTTPPTVAMTAPADGATVSGSSVAVSADASDNGSVVGVQFKLDGVNLGAEDTSAPYTLSWDSTTVADGPHSLTAVARDAAGLSTTSQAINITVSNATTPPPAGSAPIKTMSFESGCISGATCADGADSKSGTINLITHAPLKGTASIQIPNGSKASSAYIQEDFAGVDELYTSLLIKISVTPSSATRIVQIFNSGTTVGNLQLLTNRTLRLRVGGTNVGVASAPLALDTVYRIGLVQKRGTGSNGVLQAYLTTGDEAFGAPFATQTTGTWTTQANRLRLGTTTSTVTNLVFDNIMLDSGAMPGSSGDTSPTPADTTPPSVSVTAPSNGATVSGTSVRIAATATDNDRVAGVQFTLDGTVIGDDTTAPYEMTWNSTTVANGSYPLAAVARDASGNTSTATITVTVNNATSPPADTTPPTVVLTAPADGATVSGSSVAVSADASDNGSVVGVQFKLDGVNLGAEDTSAPYSLSWDSTTVANGSHTVEAVARDAAGLTAKATITVVVQNDTPPSNPTSQSFGAEADTYVSESSPSTSYGTNSQLQAVASPSSKQAFLRFTVTGLPAGATVSSAKLRLVVVNDSSSGGVFNAVGSNSWSETTTWNDKPAIDGVELANLGGVATNAVVEVDVGAVVTGNGTYSFAITLPAGNSNTLAYASRSYSTTEYRPQLIVATQ